MSEDEVLAPNWRAAKAADGKEYYFNEVTGETSWTKPAPQPQRVEPLVSDGTDVGAGNGVGNDVAARDMPGSLAPRAGAADSPDQFGSPSAPSGSSPGSGPLGPFMPKLLILLAASFVVMLQAAIEDGKEECTEVKDVSGGNCTPHNKSLVSYAVAVGTVSLLVLLGVLACARLRPELVGEKKFAMPRGKEAKPIHLLSGFLLLWWALGCGILTFHELLSSEFVVNQWLISGQASSPSTSRSRTRPTPTSRAGWRCSCRCCSALTRTRRCTWHGSSTRTRRQT